MFFLIKKEKTNLISKKKKRIKTEIVGSAPHKRRRVAISVCPLKATLWSGVLKKRQTKREKENLRVRTRRKRERKRKKKEREEK